MLEGPKNCPPRWLRFQKEELEDYFATDGEASAPEFIPLNGDSRWETVLYVPEDEFQEQKAMVDAKEKAFRLLIQNHRELRKLALDMANAMGRTVTRMSPLDGLTDAQECLLRLLEFLKA